MKNLLAPGGKILAKTPNHDSLDARLFRDSSWGGYHCPRHWVIFTPESFAAAIERAGLKVDKIAFTQGAPFWAVSALEWLGRKGLVRVNRARPMCRHPLFGPLLAGFAALDMTSVRPGAFYGWPYSYYGQHVDARVKPPRPDLVARALVPDYALGAHTASLGLASAQGATLPDRYRDGMMTPRGLDFFGVQPCRQWRAATSACPRCDNNRHRASRPPRPLSR